MVAANRPESPCGAGQLDGGLCLARGEEAFERSTDVVMLELHPVEPLAGNRYVPRQRFCLGDEVLRMSHSELVGLVRLLESLCGELADRLEHPVARTGLGFALANQALVEERLQGVGVGSRDLLSRFVRAAADEDGEPREEAPLVL